MYTLVHDLKEDLFYFLPPQYLYQSESAMQTPYFQNEALIYHVY